MTINQGMSVFFFDLFTLLIFLHAHGNSGELFGVQPAAPSPVSVDRGPLALAPILK